MIYGSDIDFDNYLKFDYSKEPGSTYKRDCLVQRVKPYISIITASYNTSEYIYKTARSIFNQTFPWFEWIIIDDGNTKPESLKILKDLEAMDSRIRIIHQENKGLGAARNNGIRNSITNIILPLDDDDMLDPTFLETVYVTFLANPEASITYTNTVGFEAMNYLWKAPFDLERMKKENVMCVCSGVRKQALMEIGMYEEEIRNINEDWHLWLRLLAKGNKPVHMNWFGFWYRRKDTNSLLTKIRSNKELMAINQKMIDAAIADIKEPVEAITYPQYEDKLGFRTYPTWDFKEIETPEPEKNRILMLLPWMIVGGADLFNLNLLKGLSKKNFDIYVMTSYKAENTLRQEFAEYAKGVFDLTTFLNNEHWPAFLDYYIKAHSIDTLFVSNNFFGYYVLPWLKKNNPKLKVVDYVHAEFPWRDGAYTRTTTVLNSFINKTYVCNEYTRKLLKNKYSKPLDKVTTVYIGVDEEKFDPEKYIEGTIRKEYNIRDNQKIILYPCRIEAEKRPFLMLEIASELKKRYSDDFIFLVVGDGSLLEEMMQKTKDNDLDDIVRFLGVRSDMANIYRDSQLTLICSLTEGLSLTAYESLAMRVPCITSDVGGQSELVDDKTGRLVPCMQNSMDLEYKEYTKEEINYYVNGIIDLTKDSKQYEIMQDNCRSRILDGFSIRAMVEIFEREFTSDNLPDLDVVENIGLMADDYLNLYFQYDLLDLKLQRQECSSRKLLLEKEKRVRELETQNESIKFLLGQLKKVLKDRIEITK